MACPVCHIPISSYQNKVPDHRAGFLNGCWHLMTLGLYLQKQKKGPSTKSYFSSFRLSAQSLDIALTKHQETTTVSQPVHTARSVYYEYQERLFWIMLSLPVFSCTLDAKQKILRCLLSAVVFFCCFFINVVHSYMHPLRRGGFA